MRGVHMCVQYLWDTVFDLSNLVPACKHLITIKTTDKRALTPTYLAPSLSPWKRPHYSYTYIRHTTYTLGFAVLTLFTRRLKIATLPSYAIANRT